MDPKQVDASLVIQKLQIRLAEAFTTIAVLEAHIESLPVIGHSDPKSVEDS